jgi:surface antigen
MAATSPPQATAGQTCRSFRETIALKDGRTDTFDARACQRADGSWEITA